MRNYLLHLFIFVFPFLLLSLIFAWWAEPIYGDLTRIGNWSEHDFGPTSSHPVIHVKATGRLLKNPDVVVLGDSFTVRNLWQSVFSYNTGYVVKSFDYQNNCLQNWIDSMTKDPTSKIIMIETIEREFVSHFSQIRSCMHDDTIPTEVQEGVTINLRPTWPPTLSLSYIVSTAINTAEMNIFAEKVEKGSWVINAPLRAGCALFSNRRNDRLLYYASDDNKEKWSLQELKNAVSNLSQIQKAVEGKGKLFVLMIVPDKSTVYQNCLYFNNKIQDRPNVTNILNTSGINTPDLLPNFMGNVGRVLDLYDPDNTHWTEAGYALAGNTISEFITKSLH
jgi:hypothetical protein